MSDQIDSSNNDLFHSEGIYIMSENIHFKICQMTLKNTKER